MADLYRHLAYGRYGTSSGYGHADGTRDRLTVDHMGRSEAEPHLNAIL